MLWFEGEKTDNKGARILSKYIIACGGTGGHLSPGIAIAEELIHRGHECVLLISEKDVDSRLIKKYSSLQYEKMPGIGFSISPLVLFRFLQLQLKALFFSFKLIRRYRPDVLVGFGGFSTLGVAVASFLVGCPIVLHEANRKTGKAIRLLSAVAKRVYLPPGVKLKSLPPKTIRHFGFPVRNEMSPISRETACDRLSVSSKNKRLLIFGGSQGAMTLNQWALDNFAKLAENKIDVYCVTGVGKWTAGKIEHKRADGESSELIFVPFVDNVRDVLCSSDLVISRAGAGSIAEFTRCGLPSILIPYPSAADDHQSYNAMDVERHGGGIVLNQSKIESLYAEVCELIFNDWLLNKMRENLLVLEAEQSVRLIVEDLERFSIHERSEVLKKREEVGVL